MDLLSGLLAGIVRFNEDNAALLGAIRASGGERDPGAQYRGPFYRWLRDAVAALLASLNIDLYLFQRRDLGLAPDRILRSLDALLMDGLRGGTGRPDA